RSLTVVPLRVEPMAVVCHPNHRFARRRLVMPADLNGERFIAFDRALPIRKAIDRALRQHGAKANIVMEFDNIETIKQAIIIAAELQEVRGALLDDTIATLGPAEPICMAPTATVEEAIARMLERRQACVLVVDGDGRLTGILTERDVLMRVAGAGREPRRTVLRDVMTPNPEALTAG